MRDSKPKKTTVWFSVKFSSGSQGSVDLFGDGLCHDERLELVCMQTFCKELAADDLNLQLFSDFAVKQRVRKCNLRSFSSSVLLQLALPLAFFFFF